MEKVKDWNYKVINKIGEGGFGKVYKCRNLTTGQIVAVKMVSILDGLEGVPGYMIREISLLRELEHENIVRVLDVLCRREYLYIVFEYLDIDLSSFITKQKSTLTSPIIKAILKQILLGLAYCHSLKVLHRDLKPSNLLIDLKSNKVKIADFGLAVSFGIPRKEYSYDVPEIACPYKAPELRIRSSEYSTPLDMWAVGCIFAEMIIGKPLFPRKKKDHLSLIFSLFGKPTEESWPRMTYKHEDLPLNPPSATANLTEKFHGLEPAGVDLLSKMLCLDPKQRITASDALEHEYLQGVGYEPLTLPAPSHLSHRCFGRFVQWIHKQLYPRDSSQPDDKYEQIREIAKGSFGVVLKCRVYETKQTVALKKILIEDPSEGVQCSVIREVALLKELEHDNIVRLLEVERDVKGLNLVFEHLDINLHDFIRQNDRGLRLIKKFLCDILRGISYCHSNKILHRDVKPKNLLINLEKRIVKIADFGLAMAAGIPLSTYINQNMTSPQVGTLEYRAPEILLGRTKYSASVDMWAVGCIFAEMVMGKRLFNGMCEDDILYEIFSFSGMPEEDTLPEVTSLSEFVLSMLPPNPTQNLADEVSGLDPDGLDLLSRMLCLNPATRITANSALAHAFLKDVDDSPPTPSSLIINT